MKSKWKTKRLGDISTINYGYTAKASFNKADSLFLRITDIQDNFVDWKTVPYCSISEIDYEKYKLIDNDIVFARTGATTGKSYLIKKPPKSVAASYLIRLRLTDCDILPEFIAKYFQTPTYWNDISLGIVGSAQGGFNASKLSDLIIPVPPIEEQKRIVEILDKAFEGIAQAEANTRRNLINARELFDSCLDNIFIEKGDNWIESILSQVCQFENGDRGKNYPNREEYVKSGIPWINTGHIQPDGTLSQSEMNFISREKYETLRGGKIQPGDLVYCLRGATIGKTALVDPLSIGAIASSLVILRPNKSLDSKFLYYFLISSPARKQIKLYDNGAAQPNLGAKSVAKYIIYFPEFSEQKNIVKKLDILAEETKKLETIYQRKLEAIAELKQSILEKAFTGQLSQ
ncbi:MAG: restriction endonuclease subunit S [bacterium]|jgi:type I restriction enzyme S subunit|uniref:restriction endonuclease subunit S n=1 Tax=Microcystis sp. TaxID=1127 RepID=UPI00391C8B26